MGTPDIASERSSSPLSTVADAARLCGVSEETIRTWIRKGKLPAEKIGGRYVMLWSDINAIQTQRNQHRLRTARRQSSWAWRRLRPVLRPLFYLLTALNAVEGLIQFLIFLGIGPVESGELWLLAVAGWNGLMALFGWRANTQLKCTLRHTEEAPFEQDEWADGGTSPLTDRPLTLIVTMALVAMLPIGILLYSKVNWPSFSLPDREVVLPNATATVAPLPSPSPTASPKPNPTATIIPNLHTEPPLPLPTPTCPPWDPEEGPDPCQPVFEGAP